jgi:ribosomal protein S20
MLSEFVASAQRAGYVSEARDFSNMVYQAILKLVKKGVLTKDKRSRVYYVIGNPDS